MFKHETPRNRKLFGFFFIFQDVIIDITIKLSIIMSYKILQHRRKSYDIRL